MRPILTYRHLDHLLEHPGAATGTTLSFLGCPTARRAPLASAPRSGPLPVEDDAKLPDPKRCPFFLH